MEGRFKTVEGVVEKFDPMPYGGHKAETFEVGNVYFEISDFNGSSYGYNNTKSHGGAIDSGKHVRIAYYFEDGRNVILRLEARN